MKEEYIIKLEEKLSSLTNEEKMERDLYLRGLANGTILGPSVGYPNIDKRWLKYYAVEDLMAKYEEKSFYRFLYDNNKDNLDKIAILYSGLKITYRELFSRIDECARALIGIGVKEGDTVAISAPTTPETIYLLYAINKIGAVSNLIDIRKDSEYLKYCLNLEDGNIRPAKVLFVYDGQVERINSFVDKTSVTEVVSISPLQSLPSFVRFAYNPKLYLDSKKKNKDYYSYNDFLSKRIKDDVTEVEYSRDRISFIEYTSGSTGFPKAVALNDSTGNHRVFQYMHNGMKYEKGDTYLDIIPIFLAFGAFVGIHLPLSMGMTDEIIPSFDANKIYSYFSKSKAKHMTLTPASFVELTHCKKFNKLDFSNKQTLGCGGDGFTAYGEQLVVERLKSQGCNVPLNNGYGGSEIGAPFCTQQNSIAKYGSVGIPLPGNNIVILKHNTTEVLPQNEIGDVCMVVDYPMFRYIANDDETKKALVKLRDGSIGVRLEDAGYVDEDGNIFVKGRYNNAIFTNKYIWPIDIENEIMKSNLVKICCAVPCFDATDDCKLFVVLEDYADKTELLEYANRFFEELNLKCNVIFKDKIEITSSGKIDRKKLIKMK